MTLPVVYSDAVKKWFADYGPVPCTRHNGRKELIDLYRTLFPDVTETQADKRVTNHIQKYRPVIDPGSTTSKHQKREIGAHTSQSPEEQKKINAIHNPNNNPVNGPINGPIAAAKKKKERWEAAFAYHQKHGKQEPLTKAEIEETTQQIIKNKNIGGLGTLAELHANPYFTFYAGLTKQQKKEDEDLRWLTKRGRPGGGRNRPVLLHADDSVITMKTARDKYGFRSRVVYESSILLNASGIEDAIQTHFKSLPLGSRRLWRWIAKGKSSDKADVEEKEIYKVFITYSTQVVEELEARTLKIDY